MFRFKWGRLLSGGILLTIIGLILTINAAINRPESYTSLEELPYERLSDNMLVEGDISRLAGKYSYNFGDGRKTYFVAALPSTMDSGGIKYISVSPGASAQIEDPRVSELRLEEWTEAAESGKELSLGHIRCRLREISEDDFAALYDALGSRVSHGDILPYYAEPYYINYKEKAAGTPEYPVGVGIVVLVMGVGAVTVWILRPVITKKHR